MRADWFGSGPNPGKDRDDQCTAILAFMVGVKPDDPIEGMIAAQLFASHAAAMECYRRAMLPNQTAYGRESNLAMAAKLTRANASQVEALTKHRGKGQQKVTVEHVHVYQGGQAIVGNVPPGGSAIIMRYNPMLLHMRQAPRCGAKTRRQSSASPRQCRTDAAGCTAAHRRKAAWGAAHVRRYKRTCGLHGVALRQAALSCRAAASAVSSGWVLKAIVAFGAALWMMFTTVSNSARLLGGSRRPPPITTQS
jgi:hypothetical protein